MEMKRLLLVLTLSIVLSETFAQQKQKRFTPERFQAELEQYITQKAGLLPKEAAKFFPVYREMVRTTREYPYISTNYKSEFFYHTAGRMVDGQRKHEPEAVALVSGDIAEEQKIQNGDMIVVETSWGKVEQEARVVEEMAKLTVALAHGWWYPEKEKSPFRLRACSNNIVPDNALRGQELPSFTTRGIPCRVYKKCREVSSHEI